MVSNSLRMGLEEVLKALKRLKREFGASPDYQKIRKDLPEDWPL